MKKRRLVGPLTAIQEQQEALKDVGLPEDLVGKIYEIISNQRINGRMEGFWIRNIERYNRTVLVNCNYLNGKMHGKYKSFFWNGRLDSEYNYINGLLEGKGVEYYLRGGLLLECNYKNGNKYF